VPFYKKRFAAANISADDIRSLDDLRRLPFTEKNDLRDNYPFGMFAVPQDQIVRIHASSGTTGKPTVGGYTRADLDLWAEVMARTLSMAGVTHKDVLHNAYGYGLFTGGLGVHLGAERIGATVVPISGGLTKRQVMLLEDFGATVLTSTPSYALVIAEEAAEQGIDIRRRFKLRVGVFGAEPWTEKMRRDLEAKLNLTALNIYGLTEVIGPGVAQECEHLQGMHIFEDVFLPEIIDPESGESLPYGEEGELVFTTLTKEAMPVIRYRTRDRTRLMAEPCACGRTLARMDRIMGRTDDMLIIRGVNVFPQLIERVLLSIEDIEPHYQIVIDRPKNQLDTVEIIVEAAAHLFQPVQTDRLEDLRRKVELELAQTLGVSVGVKLMGPKTVQRSEGKARRVIDRRELQ
jgi:phenylacetate-CoA ligase